MPDRLVIDGWDAGCSQLLIPALNSGDVLLIAFGGTDPRTNSTLYGPLAIWRQTDDGWEFAQDAVAYGGDAAQGPRAAHTILNLASHRAARRTG